MKDFMKEREMFLMNHDGCAPTDAGAHEFILWSWIKKSIAEAKDAILDKLKDIVDDMLTPMSASVSTMSSKMPGIEQKLEDIYNAVSDKPSEIIINSAVEDVDITGYDFDASGGEGGAPERIVYWSQMYPMVTLEKAKSSYYDVITDCTPNGLCAFIRRFRDDWRYGMAPQYSSDFSPYNSSYFAFEDENGNRMQGMPYQKCYLWIRIPLTQGSSARYFITGTNILTNGQEIYDMYMAGVDGRTMSDPDYYDGFPYTEYRKFSFAVFKKSKIVSLDSFPSIWTFMQSVVDSNNTMVASRQISADGSELVANNASVTDNTLNL